MSRRRVVGLAIVIASSFVAGFYAWDTWMSASARLQAAQMRACIELRDDEPARPKPPLDFDTSIQLKFHVLGLDTTSDRVKLFCDDDGLVCGVIDDLPRFMGLVHRLPGSETLTMPSVTTSIGQTATVSVGQMVTWAAGPANKVYCGIVLKVDSVPQDDGRIQMQFSFAHSSPDDPVHPLEMAGTITLRDGQTGFLGGRKRKMTVTRETPMLRDLPLIGSYLRLPRSVEIEQELIVLVTPKLISLK